ncbi:hypothetical protein [Chryseolinea serpens]
MLSILIFSSLERFTNPSAMLAAMETPALRNCDVNRIAHPLESFSSDDKPPTQTHAPFAKPPSPENSSMHPYPTILKFQTTNQSTTLASTKKQFSHHIPANQHTLLN